jgi:hypothetical protein
MDEIRRRMARLAVDHEPAPEAAAWYSPDRQYRYALVRRWSDTPPDVWVMANPSTATADADDPTIRRVCGFSRGWGAGGVVVVNLFAYRSTDPDLLDTVEDPVGPLCDRVIDLAIPVGGRTVLAWGTPGRRAGRPSVVLERLDGPLWCLTHLQDGTPGHPLFKPATLRPRPYTPAAPTRPDSYRQGGRAQEFR